MIPVVLNLGHMDRPVTNDHISFQLSNGIEGVAAVMLIMLDDRRTLVCCTDNDPNQDAAVNRCVGEIFQKVCKRHGLEASQVVWVEHSERAEYTNLKAGGWERVDFDPPASGKNPTWHQMAAKDWQSLGTEPPSL